MNGPGIADPDAAAPGVTAPEDADQGVTAPGGTDQGPAAGVADQGPTASRHELASAVLVGSIAIIAALLVVLEVSASQQGARADAAAARLASEATTKLNVSDAPSGVALGKSLEATYVAMQGTSRQMVSLEGDDAAGLAVGAANSAVWERLLAIAEEMGAVPDESSPLDPYALDVLSTSLSDIEAIVEEQNRQRDLADAASGRSTWAVLGLSLAALAGVVVGLAAVLGRGRPGGMLLALASLLAGVAAATAVFAVGWLPSPW